jgi:hypothetical protein
MQITFTLSEEEVKALSFVMESPSFWAENAIKERARIAKDETIKAYVSYALANSLTIPSNTMEILTKAEEAGVVNSVDAINAQFIAQQEARVAAEEAARG